MTRICDPKGGPEDSFNEKHVIRGGSLRASIMNVARRDKDYNWYRTAIYSYRVLRRVTIETGNRSDS